MHTRTLMPTTTTTTTRCCPCPHFSFCVCIALFPCIGSNLQHLGEVGEGLISTAARICFAHWLAVVLLRQEVCVGGGREVERSRERERVCVCVCVCARARVCPSPCPSVSPRLCLSLNPLPTIIFFPPKHCDLCNAVPEGWPAWRPVARLLQLRHPARKQAAKPYTTGKVKHQ